MVINDLRTTRPYSRLALRQGNRVLVVARGCSNGIVDSVTKAKLFPEVLTGRINPRRVAQLQEAGDPERVDRAAVRAILDGDGVFTADLITSANDPDCAIYIIHPLDAAVIAHRGLLTATQVHEAFGGDIPEEVIAPDNSGNTTPIIIPRGLIIEAVGQLGLIEQALDSPLAPKLVPPSSTPQTA